MSDQPGRKNDPLKLRLIVERFDTTQVAEDAWRDATHVKTVIVEAPRWLVEALTKQDNGYLAARVIGAEPA